MSDHTGAGVRFQAPRLRNVNFAAFSLQTAITKEEPMFIRDILSQKRYLPVKLAIVAVIASFIAVLSFHISRSSGVSTF